VKYIVIRYQKKLLNKVIRFEKRLMSVNLAFLSNFLNQKVTNYYYLLFILAAR